MAIVMNMSSYEIESGISAEAEYAEEIACSGWNPSVSFACQQLVPTEKRTTMPAELANIDVDQFLQKMYTLMG